MDSVKQFQSVADAHYCGQVTIIRAGGKWYTSFGIVDSPRECLYYMAEGETLEKSMEVAIEYNVSADGILLATQECFLDDCIDGLDFED